MEDDLKISKMEYLSNRWSDYLQSLNLSWGDQTKTENYLKCIQPSMEEDIKKNFKKGISTTDLIILKCET